MKKVILKCRFGDNIPDGKAIKLGDKDAEMLILQGMADEVSDNDDLENGSILSKLKSTITELDEENSKLKSTITELDTQLKESIELPKGKLPTGYEVD